MMIGKSMWFRRAALVAVGAPFVIGALATGPLPAAADGASSPFAGAAAAQVRFRAIKVDVSPLAENGLGPEASWMAQDLPGRLQAAFAARMAPRDAAAPTLVVRIDQVFLGASNGNPSQPFGIYGARDNIEGVGMVVAPNGKTIATYPLFSTQSAFTGGSVYEVGIERRRVDDLASSFAYWLPGQMGL
jgi:hypothetical protein